MDGAPRPDRWLKARLPASSPCPYRAAWHLFVGKLTADFILDARKSAQIHTVVRTFVNAVFDEDSKNRLGCGRCVPTSGRKPRLRNLPTRSRNLRGTLHFPAVAEDGLSGDLCGEQKEGSNRGAERQPPARTSFCRKALHPPGIEERVPRWITHLEYSSIKSIQFTCHQSDNAQAGSVVRHGGRGKTAKSNALQKFWRALRTRHDSWNRLELLQRIDVSVVGVGELHAWKLGFELDANIFSLGAAVARERQQILIAEVGLQLIEIRLKGNGGARSQIVALATSVVGHFAQVVLTEVRKGEGAAAVSKYRRVNAPEIDVLPLCAGNHGVHISVERSPCTPEVINSGGDEQKGTAAARIRPALQPIDYSKIRAGARAKLPARNVQCFRSAGVISRKILSHHLRTLRDIATPHR